MMTTTEAKKIISTFAPPSTPLEKWTEQFALMSLTTDVDNQLAPENIMGLINTYHKLKSINPDLAKSLLSVLDQI